MSGITQALLMGGDQNSISYITSQTLVANATSFTFTGVNLGPAHAERQILVAVSGASAGSASVNSVTVGGSAATNIVSGTSNNPVSLRIISIPAGATADIVVNFSATMSRCFIGVYSLIGTWTSLDSASDVTSPYSVANNTAANGALIAIAASFVSGGAPTITGTTGWSIDAQTTSATNRFAVGSTTPTVSATGATQSVSFSGSNTGGFAVATFSP